MRACARSCVHARACAFIRALSLPLSLSYDTHTHSRAHTHSADSLKSRGHAERSKRLENPSSRVLLPTVAMKIIFVDNKVSLSRSRILTFTLSFYSCSVLVCCDIYSRRTSGRRTRRTAVIQPCTSLPANLPRRVVLQALLTLLLPLPLPLLCQQESQFLHWVAFVCHQLREAQ